MATPATGGQRYRVEGRYMLGANPDLIVREVVAGSPEEAKKSCEVGGFVVFAVRLVDFSDVPNQKRFQGPFIAREGELVVRWLITGTYTRGASTGPWAVEAPSVEAARRQAEALGIRVIAVIAVSATPHPELSNKIELVQESTSAAPVQTASTRDGGGKTVVPKMMAVGLLLGLAVLTVVALVYDVPTWWRVRSAISDLKYSGSEAASKTLIQVGPKAVPALLAEFEEASGPDRDNTRRSLVRVLGKIRDPRALPKIMECLYSRDDYLVRTARTALTNFGPDGAATLVTQLRWGARPEVVAALAEFGPDAVPIVAGGLDDPATAPHCVSVLAEIGKPGVGALVSALAAGDPATREAAAAALARIEDPLGVAPLTAALQDPEPRVRAAAATALGQLREETSAPALVGALEDADPGVRSAAAAALVKLEEKAVPSLAKGFDTGRQPLRASCVRILLAIGGSGQKQLLAMGGPALPALGKALADPDGAVRINALDTLVWMKEAGRPQLRKALATPDKNLLWEYGTRLLAHDTKTYETWQELGRDSLPALTAVLEDQKTDSTTAGRAVRTAGYLRTTEAVPLLIRVLSARKAHNARADAEAAGIAAEEANREAAQRAAEDRLARREAANPRPPQSVDELVRRYLPADPVAEERKRRDREEAVRNRSSPYDTQRWIWATVRADAATALGSLGDRRAVPALEAALADDPTVAEDARRALGTLTKPDGFIRVPSE